MGARLSRTGDRRRVDTGQALAGVIRPQLGRIAERDVVVGEYLAFALLVPHPVTVQRGLMAIARTASLFHAMPER